MMVKCSVCGGEVDSIGNNKYRCRYCMHEFSESDFKTETKLYVENRSKKGVNVFDKNINGVLEIVCKFPDAVSAGSGFLVDGSGYALTNTHVVTNNAKPCNDIAVKIAGQNVRASIIALGDNNGGHGSGVDLALIKLSYVPDNATVIELDDFDKVRIGEQVFVIGNSLGYGTCMTSGIVSDKYRNVNGQKLLMTDCAVNPGNSGGPMFNENGLVIGVIVSSITGAEGMNFAIPSSTVVEFMRAHVSVKRMGGAFERTPKRYVRCPKCGEMGTVVVAANCYCSHCGHRWLKNSMVKTAPCPKCKSTNTDVENGIHYCYECEYEW